MHVGMAWEDLAYHAHESLGLSGSEVWEQETLGDEASKECGGHGESDDSVVERLIVRNLESLYASHAGVAS